MNKKDAQVIKILSDLKLRKEPTLSPSDEELLNRALDPEKQFLYDVEKLFKNNKK